ncbi:MAG: 50S ribosomal protein L11 methyltransferase [Gemmatimonadaceae bacterium]
MSVPPKAILSLAPGVVLRFRTASDVLIEGRNGRLAAGAHGVDIVQTFRTPTPYDVAVDRLASRTAGMIDYVDMVATLHELVRLGILVDKSPTAFALSSDPTRFDAAHVHVEMLNDRTRTAAYLRAIRQIVRPGDVVLDIGTGTGVFAVAAAQAGAARVYAIEATGIATAARRVYQANGFADRITLLEGESAGIELPERADVLVTEIIGIDPLGERILETTRDAVSRLLKPEARLIPSSIDVHAIPVSLPAGVRMRWRFSESLVERWRDWYGIDFSPLVDLSTPTPVAMSVKGANVHQWAAISEPVTCFSQDLGAIHDTTFVVRRTATATTAGQVDAVALYFTVALAPGLMLTTDPRSPRDDNHWRHRVWLLPFPIDVAVGDTIELTLRRQTNDAPVEVKRVNG